MGVLNLPRVTGWGTNQLPGAVNQMMERSHESEIERQKIAQRQQEQAQQQKNQMDNMKIQQEGKLLKQLDIAWKRLYRYDDPKWGEPGKAEVKAARDDINKIRMAQGNPPINFTGLDDTQTLKTKQFQTRYEGMRVPIERLNVNSDPKLVEQYESMLGQMIDNDPGNSYEGLKTSLNTIKTKQAKINSKSERDKAFGRLSPEEQKQALLKPDTVVNVGGAVEKQRALDQVKQEGYFKSPKFRAEVQRDVMSLNKEDWRLWNDKEKNDAIKIEADKRIRNANPGVQYGKMGGVEGWYGKDKNGKYTLIAPWSR